MGQNDNSYAQSLQGSASTAVDEGLRTYMVRVYNYMAGGIFLTGLVGYLTLSAAVVQRGDPVGGGLTLSGTCFLTPP